MNYANEFPPVDFFGLSPQSLGQPERYGAKEKGPPAAALGAPRIRQRLAGGTSL